MVGLSVERMVELEAFHTDLERVGDFERLMQTVAAEPHYELQPAGYALTSRIAVETFYRRCMPTFFGMVARSAPQMIRTYGENVMIQESRGPLVFPDGVERFSTRVTVIAFEGELIKGERGYADQHMGALIAELVGPDFASVPGVVRL